MTASADAPPASGGWLSAECRDERERLQQDSLPPGRVLATCSAAVGKGGLGRHLAEILGALERSGSQASWVCGQLDGRPATHPAGARAAWAMARAAAPLARFSPAWRSWRANVCFDALAAGAIAAGGEHLIAFAGQALVQQRAARAAGWESVGLMSATAHVRALAHRHELAYRRHPLERSWASRVAGRSLSEYERADRVYVSSRYALESFLEQGMAPERLSLFPLTPAPRFAPGPVGADSMLAGPSRAGAETSIDPTGAPAGRSGTFDVLYVGGLSVVKGVPVLIDAFSRLTHKDMRLLLVGGAETRAMRRYLERARARDPRIEVGPGDPLPALRRAQLYVHPSYSDGFGYAPAEALACGVPAIVSEDTGAKELIEHGVSGLVLPTGEVGALSEAIDSVYRGELLSPRREGIDAKR